MDPIGRQPSLRLVAGFWRTSWGPSNSCTFGGTNHSKYPTSGIKTRFLGLFRHLGCRYLRIPRDPASANSKNPISNRLL